LDLAEHIVNGGQGIPKEWNQEGDASAERYAELVRDYIGVVVKRMVSISQTFSGTTQRINAQLSKAIQPPVQGDNPEIPQESKEMKEELDEKTVAVCTQILLQSDKALSVLLGADKAFVPILRLHASKK
jgi:hypothetical protein